MTHKTMEDCSVFSETLRKVQLGKFYRRGASQLTLTVLSWVT